MTIRADEEAKRAEEGAKRAEEEAKRAAAAEERAAAAERRLAELLAQLAEGRPKWQAPPPTGSAARRTRAHLGHGLPNRPRS